MEDMTTIKLKIKSTKNRTVEAKVTGQGKDGNALLAPSGTVTWQGTGGTTEYLVTFFDLDLQTWIWPFEGVDDGTTGPDNAPYLRVKTSGVTKELRTDAPPQIKYEVEAENEPTVDKLDPMIIIRPPRGSAAMAPDSVLLGAVCAVLGAAVGAAVAWAMCS
jgi:hypothetical protein